MTDDFLMINDDPNDLISLTVTIAIDTNNEGVIDREEIYGPSTSSLIPQYTIRTPIAPSQACPKPPRSILIKDLPVMAQKLLCSRLNAPAIGSMKNWEYLSAIMGVSNDELLRFRRNTDPMMELLGITGGISLEKLITAIGDIQRLDVLISLRPYVEGLAASKRALALMRPPEDSMSFDSVIIESSISKFIYPSGKFSIITYHETHPSGQKAFKWFLKNLSLIQAKEHPDHQILDIRKCIDETNLHKTALSLFKGATHIVLFIASNDYISDIANPAKSHNSTDSKITIKQRFQEWMDAEFYSNGSKNYRFRVVLYQATPDSLPIGWPKFTTNYQFPKNFDSFCKRLFEE